MKNLLFTIAIVASTLCTYSQKPLIYKSFDTKSIDTTAITNQLQESEYAHIAFTSSFCKGIKGNALDLTNDVEVRIPVALKENETPDYSKNFAIDLWVCTKKGARQGTPIMSNKKSDAPADSGWIIGTNDLGAWYFNISDGKKAFTYEPTAERQAINDGNWHHIAVSVNLKQSELWMWFDGRNVAIYNIEGLQTAESKLATIIGGSDEYSDWGSRREWMAFNGKIDEVRFFQEPLTSETVSNTYSGFMGTAVSGSLVNPDRLKVQVWNIWHGGRRYGKHVGVERTIDILKETNADIIGLVETYGSGAIIADSLGYYFYLISSNLSIMSRYPIKNTIKIFKNFFSGGAILDVGDNKEIAFFDIWLNYSPDACDLFKGETVIPDFTEKEKETRQKELTSILSEIKPYTQNTDKVPVLVAGDFNSGSYLDWSDATKGLHGGLLMDWPTSRMMIEAGFNDSFRNMNPDPLKDPGFTWSPLINHITPNQNCIRDRIDFIYFKGRDLQLYRSRTLEDYPKFWPSDHGSVVSWFYLKK